MIIESLDLKNYRNYENLNIEFGKGINILYGDNAQGKTNILEALYLTSTTKSHRGSKDREIINFGKDESHIKLILNKRDISYRIDMHIKKNKAKGIAVNSIPLKKAGELFGMLNIIFFSPEDLSIIKNGPSERRRFIDLELIQINSLYLYSLIEYNRILVQRNKLLKEVSYKKDWEDTIDIWDIQLIKYGTDIIRCREKFIEDLNNIISDIHFNISGKKEKLKLVYDKNVEINNYEKNLIANRENDIKYKVTSIGPHRDDLGFFIKNIEKENNYEIDLRKYGSQGQQRSAALSLKLSEIEIVKKIVKDYPILLLDDVLSELDYNRQSKLLEAIKHIQTIITCTGVEDFLNRNMTIDNIFKVTDNKVIREK